MFGALNMVDSTLTKKFLTDLPDIEMCVDGAALMENGSNRDDLMDEVEVADSERINELIEGAEASLVF